MMWNDGSAFICFVYQKLTVYRSLINTKSIHYILFTYEYLGITQTVCWNKWFLLQAYFNFSRTLQQAVRYKCQLDNYVMEIKMKRSECYSVPTWILIYLMNNILIQLYKQHEGFVSYKRWCRQQVNKWTGQCLSKILYYQAFEDDFFITEGHRLLVCLKKWIINFILNFFFNQASFLWRELRRRTKFNLI